MSREGSIETREFSSPLKERLRQSLQGAEIRDIAAENLKDLDVFVMEVTDHDKWKSLANAQVLAGEFGEIIFNEFGEKDESGHSKTYDKNNQQVFEAMIHYMEVGDLSEADKTIVIANQEGLVGFYAYKFLSAQEEQKIIYELLSAIDNRHQNKSLGRKLFELFFTSENPDVTIGQSCTPAAVKLLIETGQSLGYASFFGNHKSGQLGNNGSASEQAIVQEFTKIAVAEHKPWAVEAAVPEGYVVGDQRYSMPPLRKEDINFSPNDPLGKTFTDELMPLQEKNNPHTVFGIQITFKE